MLKIKSKKGSVSFKAKGDAMEISADMAMLAFHMGRVMAQLIDRLKESDTSEDGIASADKFCESASYFHTEAYKYGLKNDAEGFDRCIRQRRADEANEKTTIV